MQLIKKRSTSTKKTFWLDLIKGFLIGTPISYGLMILIMVLFEVLGNMAIIWCTAATLIIVLPIMVVFLLNQKTFIAGMAAGSVKG